MSTTAMDDRQSVLGFKPQKETSYIKFLPYADLIDGESNVQLADIKAHLAKTVQLRDLKVGATHWTGQLQKYIRLYGRKFSKEDQILFIKLLFELLTQPEQELSLVHKFANLLVTLLKKVDLLTRDDLELPWKPLYNLLEATLYSPYEPHGLQLLPINIDNSLKNLVRVCRPYFSLESTAEMLEEWRPLLCPFDITMCKGISYFEFFLPTLIPPEHHDKGFKLWLEEFLGIWDTCHNHPQWEAHLISLFARVAAHNQGYIDWNPWIPKIFTRILRSFNLPVGTQKMQVSNQLGAFDVGTVSWWIASMMGGGSCVQDQLAMFFKATENFFHPSNFGKWTIRLSKFVGRLTQSVMKRIHAEKYKKSWNTVVPDDQKLTDDDITAFVKCLKDVVLLSMFSKMGSHDAALAFQHLAAMRPEIMIPPLLERVYPAMETLIEPHRLIACMNCVVASSRPLLSKTRFFPEGRSHVIPLLCLSLPGIDTNDVKKCLTTFQLISTFVSLVPIVDCSDAVHIRDDLTDDERELCSATAQWEDFVLQFMDRVITLIDNYSQDNHTHASTQSEQNLTPEEHIIEIGLLSTFNSMLQQCSNQIYKSALRKLFTFVTTSIYEIRVAGRFAGDLLRAACRADPELCLQTFVPHFCRAITAHISAEEIAKEEKLDAELLWNLTLLSEVIRCDGSYLLQYKEQLLEVLDFTLSLHAKEGYKAAAGMLEHMLKVLTNIFVVEYRSVAGGLDRPLEEHLPIRDWGKAGDFQNLDVKWHLPSQEEKAFATEILERYLLPQLEKLRKFTNGEPLSRDELLQCLTKVDHCILGAAAALPEWKGEKFNLVESHIPLKRHRQVSSLDEGITLNGENVREMVANVLRTVVDYMLRTSEDDTKSLNKLIKVYHDLLFFTGVKKEDLDGRWKSFQVVKRAMENKLLGRKHHIRALMIDRVQLQHELRLLNRYEKVFTQLHKALFSDLFKLSISRYSEVRKKAQTTLSTGFYHFAYSYRSLLPEIVKYLKNDPEVEHHQFKGALYVILGNNKRCLAAKRNWDVLELLWPALAQAQHSEKPSILRLIDSIADKIHKDVESPAISVQLSEECLQVASTFWSEGSKPVLPLDPCTAEEIVKAKENDETRKEQALNSYGNLCRTLVGLVEGGKLLWKFSHMTIELLTLMLRHDVPIPLEMVNMFMKNVVNESLNVRKICVGGVVGILKSQKRAAKQTKVNPHEIGGSTPPSTAVEFHPGDRSDNTWHHYKQTFPITNEAWESTVFVEKTHFGYWTWPKELSVYAPPSQQPSIVRSREELSEGERVLYDFFSDQVLVEKLIGFLSLEEQKGKDKFCSKNYMLFKGLFRNFGDTFLPILKPHIERLATDTGHDTHDSSHRCAAEIIAGLIRGCKHWPLEKVESMWSWLVPIIKQVLNKMTVESIAEWGTCFATASESRDPRKLKPMFDLLMETPLNSEGGSFNNASRLYVLQGALAQQEWRVPELLHRLLEYLMPFLTHSYKNVRDRLGSVLTNIFICDFMVPNGSPTTSPRRPDFIEKVLPLLQSLLNEKTLTDSSDDGVSTPDGACDNVNPASPMDVDPASPSSLMEVDDDNGENGERKTTIRLAKTVMKWLNNSYGRMLYSSPPEIFQFLPLLCQVESDTTDDELKNDALFTLGCMAQAFVEPKHIPHLLDTITKISNMASWHARANILSFIQVHVFCNFFNLQEEPLKLTIRNIVLHLLCDDQLEVREMAAITLGGLFHCGYLQMDDDLLKHFEMLSGTKLKKKKKRLSEPLSVEFLVKRHAGVLGLSACVQAYPYDVPEFIPQILMDLSDHLDDPQPIQGTVKKTLSNFRRTHHDNWLDHKQKFTDDQLVVLTDVLVSPNYYA